MFRSWCGFTSLYTFLRAFKARAISFRWTGYYAADNSGCQVKYGRGRLLWGIRFFRMGDIMRYYAEKVEGTWSGSTFFLRIFFAMIASTMYKTAYLKTFSIYIFRVVTYTNRPVNDLPCPFMRIRGCKNKLKIGRKREKKKSIHRIAISRLKLEASAVKTTRQQ